MGFGEGLFIGLIMMWVLRCPLWSKLWLRLNDKLDEWADKP